MSLTTTSNRKDYVGNGTQTVFAYDFLVLQQADLTVQVDGGNVAFTITGLGNPLGGNVTILPAPANGAKVLLLRKVAITQPTDYQEASKFPAASHESALDRLTMIIQQQQEEFSNRHLRVPISFVGTFPDVPVGTDSFLKWNAAGTALVLAANLNPGSVTFPSMTAGRIPFATGANSVGESAFLTWDTPTQLLFAQNATIQNILTVHGQFKLLTAGPHAIGGLGPQNEAMIRIVDDYIAFGTFAAILHNEATVQVPVGVNGWGMAWNPVLKEAASGTHNELFGAKFLVAYVAGGALSAHSGTVFIGPPVAALPGGTTFGTTLYVSGAPTGAATNRSLWVDAGPTQLDGDLTLEGILDHNGSQIGFFGVAPVARAAAYTVTNLTTDRSYDADTVTVAELADIVGTLIADLRLYGLVQ